MQNDAGEYVDMYIPRKWFVIAPVGYIHSYLLILLSAGVREPE